MTGARSKAPSDKEGFLVLCDIRQPERIEGMLNNKARSQRQSLGTILARSRSGLLELVVMRECLLDPEAP
jgi:hypothetical protein